MIKHYEFLSIFDIMILDTTYTNQDNDNLIKDLLGKPYSYLKWLKFKGIRCKNLIIDEVSPNFNDYFNNYSDTNANLELRPYGVIVKFEIGSKNYSWVIPYYHLAIYKTNGISFHANGRFIHFKNNKFLKKNKPFFNALLDLKAKSELQYIFTPI